jgi:transcriptional regulator with XRE-family HTH domain
MIFCREDGSGLPGHSDTDVEIGSRIGARREKLGLSQHQVAEEIGWLDAQVDDCENGLLRPPSRDLFLIADLFGVEVSHFYRGGDRFAASIVEPLVGVLPRVEAESGLPPEWHGYPGAIELFCVYARIKDPRKQRLLLELAESFARET